MGVLIAIILIVAVLCLIFQKKVICKNCGFTGKLLKTRRGSTLVEVALWCCFLVPGFIYSLWRLSNRTYECPTCSGRNLIPTDSPIGGRLEQGGASTPPNSNRSPTPTQSESSTNLDTIAKLYELRKQGALTEEEFQEQKARLIA